MADLQGIFSHNYGEIAIRDNLSREQYLYVAKLAYRIQRHDVVLKIMIKVIQKWRPINAAERDMFNRCAIGFCNKLLEDYRNFCRNVVGDDDNLELTRYYKFEMEMDLRRFCCDMIDVLMSRLVPFASTIEEEVDYLQLKGTFHHMIARLDARIGETTFQNAQSLANDHLDAANLVRLETSRAYSEFFDDISQDRERAIAISRQALSEAQASLELRNEQASNETAAVIADLQANLNLWTLRPEQFIQNLDAGDISGRNAAGAA